MADAKRDGNRVPALLGTSNADGITPIPIYADPATNRLLVNAAVTVTGLPTAVTDGEAVDAADTGNLALGTDGTNYQIVRTDSDGHVQVDVLSMPAGGSGLTDTELRASPVVVDLGANNDVTVSGVSTSAKQDTIIGHLDGVEGLLTTIAGDTTDIEAAVELIDDAIVTDDAAFTPATTKVMMSGFQADESSTDSVDEGDAGAARMTLDRKQIVTVQPHTAGGWDTFNASSSDGATALTNSAQAVKASAGQVGGWYIYNPNSSAQFVQFYNTASGSVTVGTTNPKFMLTIPATSAANLEIVNGISFGTAITIAATSTAGGNGAPSTALDAMILYK